MATRKTVSAGEMPTKYSIIIPAEIDKRLQKIADSRGVTLSALVRELLAESVAALDPRGEESLHLPLKLDTALGRGIRTAAELLHTSPESVCKELLVRHLPAVLREAREAAAALEDSLRPTPPAKKTQDKK